MFTRSIVAIALMATLAPTAIAQDEKLFTYLETVYDELIGPSFVLVSHDNTQVYVSTPGAVLVCTRDETTGLLTPVQILRNDTDGIEGMRGPEEMVLSPDGKHLYVVSDADNAVVVFERSDADSTFSFVQLVQDNNDGVEGLGDPVGIAVSPDGTSVYVTSDGDDELAVFSRDTTTGELSFVEFFRDGVDGVDGLNAASGVVVSPDGNQVYVSAIADSTITRFDRNPETGALTFVDFLKDGIDGVDGIAGAIRCAVSSDGNSVYVSGRFENALAWFSRDPITGELTYEDNYRNMGGLSGCWAVFLAEDGLSLYTTGIDDDRVGIFARNPSTGELTYNGFVEEGVGAEGLKAPRRTAVSPDGNHVYTAGLESHNIGIFTRTPASGALAFSSALDGGINDVDGLNGVNFVAFSPDGLHAYTTARDDRSVTLFTRDRGTGELVYQESLFDGVDGVDGLSTANGIVISPDGLHAYVSAQLDNGVAVFSRNTTTGALTYVENIVGPSGAPGDPGVLGIRGAIAVDISPDGNHVYVRGISDSGIGVFSRAAGPGTLTHVQAIHDGVDGVDGLSSTGSIAVAPDGKHLYSSSGVDDGIGVFSRNEGTGELTFVTLVTDTTTGMTGLENTRGVAVSPDGNNVYAVGAPGILDDSSVVVFDRDSMTGLLTFVEVFLTDDEGVSGLEYLADVNVSPDGGHVIAVGSTSFTRGAVAIFSRSLATGELVFAESYVYNRSGFPTPSDLPRGLIGANEAGISPDSAYLHVVANVEHGVSIFEKGVLNLLRGTVTDLATGNPVACGVIELANGDRSVVVTAVTDETGFYFFADVPFGTYNARVISPGLEEVMVDEIMLNAGQVQEENIALPTTSRAGDIAGNVSDAVTAVPLVGVRVDARVASVLVATTYTCSTGDYEIALPDNKGDDIDVELTFSLDNYDTVVRDVTVTPGELLIVNQTMTKTVGFPASLGGLVLDDEDSPIADARVTIRGPVNTSGLTDSNGTFTFDVLEGQYTMRASKVGFIGQTAARSVSSSDGVSLKTFNLEPDDMPNDDPEDVNMDGSVNSVDIQIVINEVLGFDTGFNADINNSGGTNSVDIQLVINRVLGV